MSLTAKYGNWIAETTATTGTGNITLSGALSSQYATFSAVVSENDQIYYHIFDRGTNDQEAGIASVLVGGALLRTPQATLVNGVYDNASPSAISLSGDAIVYGSATADTLSLLSNEVQASLPKDGSEPMTGQLILSGDATSDLGAVPRQQLNAELAVIPNNNLLDNPDFKIVQRGTGSFVIGVDTWFADRWRMNGSGAQGTFSRTAFSQGSSNTFALIADITVSDDYTTVIQQLEGMEALIGQTVTFSMYARTNVTGLKFRMYARREDSTQDFNGFEILDIPNTNGNYQWMSFTTTIPSRPAAWWPADGYHLVLVLFDSNANPNLGPYSFGFTYPKLEMGSRATPYTSAPIADQFARCQRYYQTGEGITRFEYTTTAVYGSRKIWFPQQMRAIPAVSAEGDVSDANAGNLTTALISKQGFQVSHPSVTPGEGKYLDVNSWSADAEF